jgi:hypothetical protein
MYDTMSKDLKISFYNLYSSVSDENNISIDSGLRTEIVSANVNAIMLFMAEHDSSGKLLLEVFGKLEGTCDELKGEDSSADASSFIKTLVVEFNTYEEQVNKKAEIADIENTKYRIQNHFRTFPLMLEDEKKEEKSGTEKTPAAPAPS